MTSLFILAVIFVALMTAGVFAGIGGAITSRKRYGLPLTESYGLSWPAKQIIREYRELPEENRPYANVVHIVKALDVKYGAEAATDHFRNFGLEHSSHSWRHNCLFVRSKDECRFGEYRDIHNNIEAITKALEYRKHQLELAGVEDGLAGAKELTDALREERKLIQDVTKELT